MSQAEVAFEEVNVTVEVEIREGEAFPMSARRLLGFVTVDSPLLILMILVVLRPEPTFASPTRFDFEFEQRVSDSDRASDNGILSLWRQLHRARFRHQADYVDTGSRIRSPPGRGC